MGRYIQGDPLGLVDGASVYGYVLQSPNRYTDFRGENAVTFGRAAFGLGTFIGGRLAETAIDAGIIGGIAQNIVDSRSEGEEAATVLRIIYLMLNNFYMTVLRYSY